MNDYVDHSEEILASHSGWHKDWHPILTPGEYYYRKKTGQTVRFDGWAMQMWTTDYEGNARICWDDIGNLDELEPVTWGTKAIPLQDFSHAEHY